MSLKDFLNISRSGGKGRFRPVTVAVHQREEQDSKVLKLWGEGGRGRLGVRVWGRGSFA